MKADIDLEISFEGEEGKGLSKLVVGRLFEIDIIKYIDVEGLRNDIARACIEKKYFDLGVMTTAVQKHTENYHVKAVEIKINEDAIFDDGKKASIKNGVYLDTIPMIVRLEGQHPQSMGEEDVFISPLEIAHEPYFTPKKEEGKTV